MNKHILLVMKWQNDNNSVTQEELEDNRDDAWNAYRAANANANATAHAAYAAAYWAAKWATTDAEWAAAYARAANAAHIEAAYWVNIYFDHTGENKEDYIDYLDQHNRG